MITLEELKGILHYDPESGIFTWLKTVNSRAVKGSIAGHKDKKHQYIDITFNRVKYKAHKLAWFYTNGVWPENEIDHKNRDKQDNSFCNLREATRSQNNMNKTVQGNNASGYKGVYLDGKKYKASICLNKNRIYLGSFTDPIEAAKAYDIKAKELFGEFAYQNFNQRNKK